MRVEYLSSIADAFDGMIIDQFGVLHDGHAPYPGAVAVMRALQTRGIPVAVLTNSGKRVAANRDRLVALGIPRETFVDVVTSGELAYHTVLARAASTGRPPRAHVVGKTGDDYGLDGITLVDDPRAADVLLILSSDAPRTSLDDYRDRLAGLTLPAICCNPDRWMITRDGLLPGPGAIAAMYEEMGGRVTWIGKPYPAIYEHAARLLGNPSRVLCIGDSAEHDIAGGRAAGFDTLLVMTGVSDGLDPSALTPTPGYWMEALTW
jgi:HAD superfamily hydrolase (TIGR01459 family)